MPSHNGMIRGHFTWFLRQRNYPQWGGTRPIKRLVRKTICFSKSTQMHDIVIGLFVNRYAFGRTL
jgi:hypothetical protein